VRRLVSLPLGLFVALALAVPVFAAPPMIETFEDDDLADSAFFTARCGFPVLSESHGHVVLHNEKSGATNFIANYNIRNTLTSEFGTYNLVDAGPDMEKTKGGTTYLTVTGRSLTFSTVIGRVEINLDTDEVTWHGRLLGTEPLDPAWWAPICDALDGTP
jgi:hypothetical protein